MFRYECVWGCVILQLKSTIRKIFSKKISCVFPKFSPFFRSLSLAVARLRPRASPASASWSGLQDPPLKSGTWSGRSGKHVSDGFTGPGSLYPIIVVYVNGESLTMVLKHAQTRDDWESSAKRRPRREKEGDSLWPKLMTGSEGSKENK